MSTPLAAAVPLPSTLTVTSVDDATWDAYVDAHPGRTAYHYAGWPRLIARAFRHEAVLLACDGRDGVKDGAAAE